MKKFLRLIICFAIIAYTAVPAIQAQQIIEEFQVGEAKIRLEGSVDEIIETGGRIFVGGNFSSISLNDGSFEPRNHFSEIIVAPLSVTSWNPDPNGNIEDMHLSGNELIVAGHFTQIHNMPRQYLASLDINNRTLNSLSLDIDGPVYAVERDNETIYAAGGFSSVNSQERKHITSYNLASNELTSWNPEINDNVFAALLDSDILYIGGSFSQINGVKRERLAAFDIRSGELLTWNPQVKAIIQTLSLENGRIIAKGYLESEDDTAATQQQVIIERESGRVLSETIITPVPMGSNLIESTSPSEATVAGLMVDPNALGFKIPTLSDILTFMIRGFFVVAGLAALFFMLLGAFSWVTSGGDKDAVQAARDKIQSAVIGVLMIVAVLSVVWTLEQVIFKRRICFGISCPVTIPSLLEPT